jgi:hypothetical protein
MGEWGWDYVRLGLDARQVLDSPRMDKELLKAWLAGHAEVNRITNRESLDRTFEQRWSDREQVQALLTLMPFRPLEDVEQPRARWTLLKDRWLERRA